MIQSAHILTGASLTLISKDPLFFIPAAIISHYLLDLIPHKEYALDHLHKLAREGRYDFSMLFDLLKGALDITLAYLAVIWFTNGDTYALLAAFVATIPDMFHPVDIAYAKRIGAGIPHFSENPYVGRANNIITKFLKTQRTFHRKVHLMDRADVPRWLGVSTQVITIATFSLILFNSLA